MENETKQPEKIDLRQVFFSMAELRPILKEWALALKDNPKKPLKHKNPTNFPDVLATKPDGSPTTLEELMKEMGIVPMIPVRLPIKPETPKPSSIKELPLFVNIFLNKPGWMPKLLWDKELVQKIFRWFIRNNATITIINKDDLAEKVAYDSKTLP